MKIYIMRHGEAQQFAPSDAQRALTDRGRHESEAVARACANQRGVKGFDLVLVSPYLRAQQTWETAHGSFFRQKSGNLRWHHALRPVGSSI